jgi:hypothetical protein
MVIKYGRNPLEHVHSDGKMMSAAFSIATRGYDKDWYRTSAFEGPN